MAEELENGKVYDCPIYFKGLKALYIGKNPYPKIKTRHTISIRDRKGNIEVIRFNDYLLAGSELLPKHRVKLKPTKLEEEFLNLIMLKKGL